MRRFYTELLGQKVRFDFGACITLECALTIWQPRGDGAMIKALGGERLSSGNSSLEVCFESDEDFNAEAARVKAGGAPLLHDVAEEAWGQRTIRFFDPDGNIVELGESVPCFCRRLYREGMSADEIALQTGVQKDMVLEYLNREQG